MTREEHPGGRIAMKLLQGYLWQPLEHAPLELPGVLPDGSSLVFDEVRAPFAFFDDGTYTGTQRFYQLTVLRVFPEWPENAEMAAAALEASEALAPILYATPEGVGWSLNEDLRPA